MAPEMLRNDLAAASIPYQDDSGRYFDFHAMRGQFISLLAAGGVHPEVAQALARHSTITLTMDTYAHVLPQAQREALALMDDLFAHPASAAGAAD